MKTLEEIRSSLTANEAAFQKVNSSISRQKQILEQAVDDSKLISLRSTLEDISAAAELGDLEAAAARNALRAELQLEESRLDSLREGEKTAKEEARLSLAGLERQHAAVLDETRRLLAEEKEAITRRLDERLRAADAAYHAAAQEITRCMTEMLSVRALSQRLGARPLEPFEPYPWHSIRLPYLSSDRLKDREGCVPDRLNFLVDSREVKRNAETIEGALRAELDR